MAIKEQIRLFVASYISLASFIDDDLVDFLQSENRETGSGTNFNFHSYGPCKNIDMPRQPRNDIGNQIYHVINRANSRVKIFLDDTDYELFEQTLIEGQRKLGIRLLGFIIMPNYFPLRMYKIGLLFA